jgi:hypothetical protein
MSPIRSIALESTANLVALEFASNSFSLISVQPIRLVALEYVANSFSRIKEFR